MARKPNPKTLARKYRPLAFKIIWKFVKRDRMLNKDEVESLAMLALVRAANRWRNKRKNGFVTAFPVYAQMVIERHLIQHARSLRTNGHAKELYLSDEILDRLRDPNEVEGSDLFILVKSLLSAKDYKLVRQRFVLGLSLDEIGVKEGGLSKSAIRRRLGIVLEKIRPAIEEVI